MPLCINWNLLSLESIAGLILVGLVLIDIFKPAHLKQDLIGQLSIVGILGLLILWATQGSVRGTSFSGMFVADSLSWFFKGFFLTVMLFVLAMSKEFFKDSLHRRDVFYLLLWLALLGMFFVASSADFLLLFISIEILTISLYVMTAYLKTDKLSIEAGMKYLILGALASGFFLYGISYLYGITHSTRFEIIQEYIHQHPLSPMTLLALVLIFSAAGFKIAAVPFQWWVPDVYQGAPTPVTALLSVGSKAAGFIFIIRVFMGVFASWHGQLAVAFAVLSALTMCYGNLTAMFQSNIKRLLGYSSIGHAGYLLMGLAAGSLLGGGAISFYLLTYLFANLAIFLVLVVCSKHVKGDEISDYAGLHQRNPLLASSLLLSFVSLAGIPPLVGFFGKFSLLIAVVKSGFVWLALVAGVNIVISLYYYLLVIKSFYVAPARITSPIAVPGLAKGLLVLSMLVLLIMGILQGPYFDISLNAVKGMLFSVWSS